MRTRQVVYAGVLIAIGVLIPQIFHMVGGPGLGATLLPMHLSVLVAGFLLNPVMAFLVGLLTPVCSFFYTGGAMPPIPILYYMMVELGFYALGVSILSYQFKRGIWVSLIGGMIIGRLVRGLVLVVLAQLFGMEIPASLGVVASFVQGIPGVIVQLVVLPPFIHIIKKRGWLENEQTASQGLS